MIMDDQRYLSAEADVAKLLAVDETAIRRAREHELSFCKFTPALLKEVTPSLTDDVAVVLCARF